MSGLMESCPECLSTYGFTVGGLGSGIGSSNYICSSCKKEFRSGRREWTEMTTTGKVWYCVASLLYVAVLGFAGGVVGQTALEEITGSGPAADPTAKGPAFWVAAVVTAVGIVILQSYRVILSIQRTACSDAPPIVASYFSWQTNLQIWSAGIVAILFGLADVMGWLLHGRA